MDCFWERAQTNLVRRIIEVEQLGGEAVTVENVYSCAANVQLLQRRITVVEAAAAKLPAQTGARQRVTEIRRWFDDEWTALDNRLREWIVKGLVNKDVLREVMLTARKELDAQPRARPR